MEYRSRATRIIGERFYLYAAGKWPGKKLPVASGQLPGKTWSTDLAGDIVPAWMAELANGLRLFPHELSPPSTDGA